MRPLVYLTFGMLAFSTPLLAGTHYSDLIRTQGLAGASATLSDQNTLTPSDAFALGGVQFLTAVEGALQNRYRHDLNSEMMSEMTGIPFLRLPVAANPAPEPFTPDVVTTLFQDAIADLDLSLATLDTIQSTDEVAVLIRPADLWFDINANGTADPGESFGDVVASTMFAQSEPLDLAFEIRFDTADAAWLSAYAHMLSGISELILATDPEQAIRDVYTGAATIDALRGNNPIQFVWFDESDLGAMDAFAILFAALEGPVDATRTRAARQHFRDGLKDNRDFWLRVEAETDNVAEWVPNIRQESVLPLTFPTGFGAAWQAVLADAEAVLDGRLLLPYWRSGESAGVNLAALLQLPPQIELLGMLQGYTLAPYIEAGPVTDFETLLSFNELTNGNFPLFAFVLN